jgi:hypothetical protein
LEWLLWKAVTETAIPSNSGHGEGCIEDGAELPVTGGGT